VASRFYASISGSAVTEATRQGSKNSGIHGHIRGCEVGIMVIGSVGDDENDEFDVYLTSGSYGIGSSVLIGTFTRDDLSRKLRVVRDDE
jgi:hypothetical protein